MKRILIIITIIVAILAAGYYFLFSSDNGGFSKDSTIYKAVPVSSPFFFEIKSLRSIPTDHTIIRQMADAGIGKDYLAAAARIDSLVKHSKNLPNSLTGHSFLLSFGFTGRNEPEPLLISQVDSKSRKNALVRLIEHLYPEDQYQYQKRDYSNFTITEISGTGSQLYYSFAEGLFLASAKSLLVEQAILQLETQGIWRSPYFRKVNKTASAESAITCYVNHSQFPLYLKTRLNGVSVKEVNEFGDTETFSYRKMADYFTDFSSWSEFDMDFNGNQLILAGVTAADDSLNHFLSVFDDQAPARFDAENVLPKNTSFFCSYTFSDKKAFFKRLEKYFSHSSFYYKREENFKRMESGFRVNAKTVFQEIVKDEVIVATTTIPVNAADKTTLFIMGTTGKSKAREQLELLLSTYASRKQIEFSTLAAPFVIDRELQFTIYKFPYPSFPGTWLGQPFKMVQAKYAAFYNNYLVFSNNEQGLQDYLHDMTLESTLTKDALYQQVSKDLSSRANINIFLDVNKTFGLSGNVFTSDIIKKVKQTEENLRKFRTLSWQMQHNNGIYFNSLVMNYSEKIEEEALTTWQSSVGANVRMKPVLVVNHTNPRSREIILQDEKNNLHLVTAEGRIRWSIPLSGPIMGEVFQVDYFKNRNLQYLFNTKEKLYLVDRNGNNVENFPVSFRSPATNGVNVFDYDNNRNYRYFVACEDLKVYAYDHSGKILSGWDFDKTDFPVTTPVQHFRVGSKDYIVLKDESRIYILDRRGQVRVPVTATFANSRNPLVLNLSGTPKIVATDTQGQVYYLYFDGKYKQLKKTNYSANHYFACDDLNGNGVPDFVFADENRLEVVDENGKKLFSEKFSNPIKAQPGIYSFGAKLKKVGIADVSGNRIYLFNPDGKPHQGFPLQGNSEFTIGTLADGSEQMNLVVGSQGGVLYNYTLQ